MLVKRLWILWIGHTVYPDYIDYLWTVIFTPIVLIFDIILLPFEIIAFILYKKLEGDK